MTETQTRRFNLTPFTVDGHRVFADVGAVAQQNGTKPVFACDCGANVVWVKSAKTGRSYLAHAMRYTNSDRFYYIGGSVHTWERHDAKVADRAAWVAAEEAKRPENLRAAMLADVVESMAVQAARPWSAREATLLVEWVWRVTDLADRLYPV